MLCMFYYQFFSEGGFGKQRMVAPWNCGKRASYLPFGPTASGGDTAALASPACGSGSLTLCGWRATRAFCLLPQEESRISGGKSRKPVQISNLVLLCFWTDHIRCFLHFGHLPSRSPAHPSPIGMTLYFKKSAFTVLGHTVSFEKLSLPAHRGDQGAGGKPSQSCNRVL